MTTAMNTGAASLLPCPMCGAAPKLIVGYSPLNHAFVDCDCGMQTALKDTAEEVTAMWNRRSPTPQADADFKNFHRLLCERFGYVHDEKDWIRDQLSLIEHIASRAAIAAGGAQETAAARDALAERQRQVAVEGFAPEQDDRYQDGSLAGAAICYALTVFGAEEIPNYYWPRTWSASWWKPTTPRRNLVKAAALILAEIERIDRAAPGTCFFCSEPMNSAHESDCPQAPTAASNGAPK